jgi:hypothetical protein
MKRNAGWLLVGALWSVHLFGQTGASISTNGQNITMQQNVSVTGTLGAPVIGGLVIVTAYASAGDIGQQFAAAYAANGQTSYYIPAGTYATSHTISITPQASGNISLFCAPGTTIQYSGSGDAFAALGTGQSQANLVVSGCRFSWTGSSGNANGVHLEAFNKATLIGVRADGFSNGDGFFNQGVNTVDFYSIQSTGNLNGIHNVGVVVSGTHYAANALHFTGGVVSNNSQWGAYEDAALAATVGANENNTYRDIAFEANGTPSATTPLGGQMFIQACLGCGVYNNYFEYSYSGSLTMTTQIALGDATNYAVTPVVRDNFFATNGGTITNAINAVNCNRGLIEGNLDEDGPETNFLNNGSLSQWTYLGFNYSNATTYATGSGSYSASVTATSTAANAFGNPGNSTMQLLWSGSNTVLRSATGGTVYLQDGGGNNMAVFTTSSASFANGANVVYRCTVAGALPVGFLTISAGNCGSSTDSGLRVK